MIVSQAVVKCPKCADSRTHLERAVVSQGHYTTIVDKENDRLVPHSQMPERSGSVVDVYMWCESGHSFIISMEYVAGSVLSSIVMCDDHDGDLTELWVAPE